MFNCCYFRRTIVEKCFLIGNHLVSKDKKNNRWEVEIVVLYKIYGADDGDCQNDLIWPIKPIYMFYPF